jgi:hypothetical protein
VEGLFGEGYDALCVVRDDIPHLPTAFYTEAFGRLENGAEAAIVPDEGRGGHVLIGLRADAATPGARASLLTAGTADIGLRAAFLPRWYLIDAPTGLSRLRTDLRRGTAHAPRTRRILETLEPKTT